jgi:hypothetical protein
MWKPSDSQGVQRSLCEFRGKKLKKVLIGFLVNLAILQHW